VREFARTRAHGGRQQVRRVRGGDVGLGHREARARPALGQRAQVGLELLGVACDQQRVHVPLVGRHRVQAERGEAADAALLRDERHAEHADAEAAPLLGQVWGVDAAFARRVAQPLDGVPAREQVARVLDLGLRGQHILHDERANAGHERLQLGRDVKTMTPSAGREAAALMAGV